VQPTEMTAIFPRSQRAENCGQWLVVHAVPPKRSAPVIGPKTGSISKFNLFRCVAKRVNRCRLNGLPANKRAIETGGKSAL
jgi:hypothetical protein